LLAFPPLTLSHRDYRHAGGFKQLGNLPKKFVYTLARENAALFVFAHRARFNRLIGTCQHAEKRIVDQPACKVSSSPRSAHRQASRKRMFCALSTMYLRERLAETESIGVLPVARQVWIDIAAVANGIQVSA
jgi:hypothetical protein